ncbi:MAG: Cof-type HAD-IIB family hydrolase [Faecalimonas sp.]|nr:Cof-type HAD-IIB family hydrolase [Faecalimonas sp.]
MKHKIKMVGLDLDGTLLTTKKELSTYSKAVLEEAIRQGVAVVIATGRPISAIAKDVLAIEGIRYALTSNGARILDMETGEVLVESMLAKSKTEELLRLLEHYDAILEIFIDGVSYVRKKEFDFVYDYYDNPSAAKYMLDTRNPVEDLFVVLSEKGKAVDKVHCIFKHMEEQREATALLREVEGIVAESSYGFNIEINKAGTDKGIGLLRLGEALGIRQEEIMACGDAMNDYEMLKAVGFAVAMDNAVPKVKELADYVTASNDEDGVAKAIERFVLDFEER